MLDQFAILIEALANVLVRSSDIMNYSVWARRLVLVTFPVSIPLLAVLCAIGSLIVYAATLIMSVVYEVREEGVAYLFHAPAVADLLRR
jgi:hypothetical protein